MAAQPPGVLMTPHSFIICKTAENALFRSLKNILNNIGAGIDPWCTGLVSGLQLDIVLFAGNCGGRQVSADL